MLDIQNSHNHINSELRNPKFQSESKSDHYEPSNKPKRHAKETQIEWARSFAGVVGRGPQWEHISAVPGCCCYCHNRAQDLLYSLHFPDMMTYFSSLLMTSCLGTSCSADNCLSLNISQCCAVKYYVLWEVTSNHSTNSRS